MMASILGGKLRNPELLSAERLTLLFRVANQAEKLGMNMYLLEASSVICFSTGASRRWMWSSRGMRGNWD